MGQGLGNASQSDSSHPTPNPQPLAPVTGVIGDVAATRSGEDTRRRGWFWHWNSIVTQYAPLIGLKGVGLVNSYTVWTDRREESPHRGYAFPSQQSEADFYGEDRAELIAINKILVALNLIEIRKEMVLRVDDQGRRWKVPHNFYRVKDHGDGFILGGGDVLKVVELADRDQAVYRYIRHIFSSKFSPIDADNVWTRILPEIQQTEVWQRLAAKVAREEHKASARTKAGHAARKANLGMPSDVDTTTTNDMGNDSEDVATPEVDRTSVALINNGSKVDVAGSNNGLDGQNPTTVAPTNRGSYTSVARSNRTYNQDSLTTTTTTDVPEISIQTVASTSSETENVANLYNDLLFVPDNGVNTTRFVTDTQATITTATGPGSRPAPTDAAGETTAIKAFEDANSRRSTPAERQLLRGLAERFDPTARDRAQADYPTGWAWLTASIYEAVEAGSAFVAPRRLREILSRWERDGMADEGGKAARRQGGKDEAGQAVGAEVGGRQTGEENRGSSLPPRRLTASPPSSAVRLGEAGDIAMPHGFGSRRTWEFTVALLGSAIDKARLAELVEGTAIVGYAEGEVTIEAPTVAQGERIVGEYRELIARKLSEAMRRPVRIAVTTPVGAEGGQREADEVGVPVALVDVDGDDDEVIAVPSFVVAECGLPSGQVWAAVLEEVLASGRVGRANFDAWLRTTALIGRGNDGQLIVGVPHGLAQRRVSARFGRALEEAVAAIVGVDLPIEFVVERDWLRARLFTDSGDQFLPEMRKAGA